MRIGVLIKRYRKEAKLSQTELSRKSGIPQTTISDWENGKSIPNVQNAQDLSKALGIDIEKLLV